MDSPPTAQARLPPIVVEVPPGDVELAEPRVEHRPLLKQPSSARLEPLGLGRKPVTERQAQVRETLRTGSLIIVAAVAAGVMLIYLRFLLVPLVLAKFLHYLIDPFVRWLHVGRRPCSKRGKCACRNCCCCYPCARNETCRQLFLFGRVPHWLAVFISLLLVAAIISGIVMVIVVSVTEMLQDSAKYEVRLKNFYTDARHWADTHGFNHTTANFAAKIVESVPITTLSEMALSLITFVVGFFEDSLMLFLFLVYMVCDSSYMAPRNKETLRGEVDAQIRHYIFVKSLISLVAGVLQGAALWALKVDLALIFGFLAFLFNFIPNVGPIFAILLPLPLVLLDPALSWTNAILAMAVPSGIHLIIGNFVEPKGMCHSILGRQMDLHPIVILCALVFWTAVWGAVGAIMSVPLTAVIRLALANIDHPICQNLASLLSENIVGHVAASDEATLEFVGLMTNCSTRHTTYWYLVGVNRGQDLAAVVLGLPKGTPVILGPYATRGTDKATGLSGVRQDFPAPAVAAGLHSLVSVVVNDVYTTGTIQWAGVWADGTVTGVSTVEGPAAFVAPAPRVSTVDPESISWNMTLRDFNAHPDFEHYQGDDRGIVKEKLGDDGTPTLAPGKHPTIFGEKTFQMWYHDEPGVNKVLGRLPVMRI
eukprot:m51a1_g14677 hypothetical protein (650) ;mRNA; r:54014-57079